MWSGGRLAISVDSLLAADVALSALQVSHLCERRSLLLCQGSNQIIIDNVRQVSRIHQIVLVSDYITDPAVLSGLILMSGFSSSRDPVHTRFKVGGTDGLRSRPRAQAVKRPARPSRAGPAGGRHGERVVGELWTLDCIGLVIQRLTGIRHHPVRVLALLHYRPGWSVQRPERRAAERDQDAIDRWVKERWPAIKQTPNDLWWAWEDLNLRPHPDPKIHGEQARGSIRAEPDPIRVACWLPGDGRVRRRVRG
jgi:transposase